MTPPTHTIAYDRVGSNGTTKLYARVTRTESGEKLEPIVEVTEEKIRDAAFRLAQIMGLEGTGFESIERDLKAALDGEELIPVQSVEELCRQNPVMRPPLIHDLLREGETMSVVSMPKVGKSHAAGQLALSVVTGHMYLGKFQTEPGPVLIVDNELHRETLAGRIPRIAAAMGVGMGELSGKLQTLSLRGQLKDVFALGKQLDRFKKGTFKIVVVDSFYRTLPRGFDENSNADMTAMYNQYDAYADRLGSAFVLIHHTSKGVQSGKAVTDVGAGAGSQSRAVDTHLVLRQHEEDNAVVVDAAVRSWPPVEPFCMRWEYPTWRLADDLNPDDLRQDNRGRRRKPEGPAPVAWTVETFVQAFVTGEPQERDQILAQAFERKLKRTEAINWLTLAEGKGLVHRWTYSDRRRKQQFATKEQPVTEAK